MDRTYRLWYFLVLLLALVPPGVQMLLWLKPTAKAVDQQLAKEGEVLFNHEWTVKDPLSPKGDGIGPVYNAKSCVACHFQGGVGGSSGREHNVTNFTVAIGNQTRQGVIHSFSIPGVKPETFRDIDPTLPDCSTFDVRQVVNLPNRANLRNRDCVMPTSEGVSITQRNTPALFGAKLIDEIPERIILANAKMQLVASGYEADNVGRALRLPNGKIGRFGWKAQMSSLTDFVQGACANELGLGNPGQAQPTPIYAVGQPVQKVGYDLTLQQCDALTEFCAGLPKPVEIRPNDVSLVDANHGKKLFSKVGCANCHTPNLGSVEGVYSDLLLHRMSPDLVGGGSYGGGPTLPPSGPSGDGPEPAEWRTPPLWGVADSAPYMHDGRAETLEEAINLHAGPGSQGAKAAGAFAQLPDQEKAQLIGFLRSLRAPQK